MQTGKETWKWGAVVILLAIFLITANQAYQHIASQETFDPPDDYLKGDSWDLEHQNGPGAGQPMQMPVEQKSQTTPTVEQTTPEQGSIEVPSQIVLDDDIDWNQSDAPAAREEKPEEEVAPAKVEETLPTSTEVTPVENVAPAKAEESVPTTETVPAKVEETSSAIESAAQKAEEKSQEPRMRGGCCLCGYRLLYLRSPCFLPCRRHKRYVRPRQGEYRNSRFRSARCGH